MNREEILDSVGDFTWMFDQHFFISTKNGNYVWSDPDYNGDNTLRRYNGTYHDFNEEYGKAGWGRSKGRHIIGDRVGVNVVFKEM